MPAKLPPERIDPPVRYVRDLQIGEEGYVTFVEMKVDLKGDCYLSREARLRRESAGSTLTVNRDHAGYHITAGAQMKGVTWSKQDFRKSDFYPVESFTEDTSRP